MDPSNVQIMHARILRAFPQGTWRDAKQAFGTVVVETYGGDCAVTYRRDKRYRARVFREQGPDTEGLEESLRWMTAELDRVKILAERLLTPKDLGNR